MKIFVVGANGQIGKKLVTLLHESDNYSVRAMVRAKEQGDELTNRGIENVVCNLTTTVDEIAEVAKGCDGIVFTAGSGSHTGADQTLLVDLDGAVKTMEAAKKVGIDRFIMVSALQAHNRENWNDKIKHYYAAKHYADRMLIQLDLNYTIIRPGRLLNDPGSGLISAAENLVRSSIPREDVAKTIFSVLEAENTFKKGFDLTSGDIPIEEAIKRL